MGTGNSKDKKSDKKAPKEDAKSKGTATAKAPKNPETPTEKAPATNTATSPATTHDKDEEDIHESWNDQVLFARNEGTKAMTKDDFEVIATIGKGSFGKVLQVRKKDDSQVYAMKILRKEAIIARKQVAHTKAEKSILSKIQHPFIVRLHFAFQTKDKLYMVLDFVNGGELFFHLKNSGRFPENRVKFYSAEIVCAIAHLHSLGIVYRDLKPENILLDSDGHICITDFGLSKEIKPDEGTHTFCGTPEYLAPEVLKGQGHGTAVDWWSLGTLIYEMLTGLPPFYSQNINMMYQKILNAELKFPSHVSPAAQDLLTGLLTRDPEKRLGNATEGTGAIKKHPFFADIDWEKLEKREIEPPFKPGVRSKTDISQIDTMFTGEKAIDSVVENSTLTDAKDAHFDGFTYVSDNVLDA